MDKLKNINVGLLLIVMLLLAYYTYKVIELDNLNRSVINNTISHQEVDLPDIPQESRLVIEQVIEEYWTKRSMNKSKCANVLTNIKIGTMRGALAGAVLGGGTSGIASGAIVYGALSGLASAYKTIHGGRAYLNDAKAI